MTAASARSLSPAIQRLMVCVAEAGSKSLTGSAGVDLGEARGVPQLGREVAVALDARGTELDVAPLRRHRRKREAQRIGAISVDQLERVDDVAFRLRHLLALLVADQRMDVDVAERHFFHDVQAHHHHAGDPEEDDVEAGDENVGRVVALHLGRLVGPAEGGERPERGGEPGVEHVLVAGERDALAVMLLGEGGCLRLVLGDEDLGVGAVPRGDLVAPPELARDAPGLDSSPSNGSRCSPRSWARTPCGRASPRRWPASPRSWRRHTIGRSGTAR